MNVFTILFVLFKLIIITTGNDFNQTQLRSLSYTWPNGTSIKFNVKTNLTTKHGEVDCLGIGTSISNGLAWLFLKNDRHSNALDIRFFLTSRNKPRRVQVIVGRQFGLEWTDFKIERKTIIIVHGFLSNGEESWIKEMQEAFLLWVR